MTRNEALNEAFLQRRLRDGVEDGRQVFLASLAASGFAIVPVEATAKHIKRGTTYDVLGEAHIQTDKPLSDMNRVVVYRCHETGHLWARRYAEFIDGRFEIVAAQKEQG